MVFLRFAALFLFCLSAALPPTSRADANLPLLRISVENSDKHVHTKVVETFAKKLSERLEGQIDVRFYANATLFRDKDVIKALGEGKVEVAVPGTWHLMNYEPNVGLFLLPHFYHQPAEENYRVLEGGNSRQLIDRIEEKIPVKVIGRWIDLGYAHVFSLNKEIRSASDIAGLRVRVAGGKGNTLRIKALGGQPTTVAWPDLPQYLEKGKIDAVLTSYESVRSASLWQYGINYVYEDQQYFPQYVPLIRQSFWNKLTPQQREIVVSAWDEGVDAARADASEAQERARKVVIENGLTVVIPPPGRDSCDPQAAVGTAAANN